MNFLSLVELISNILADANEKIGKALIERATTINNLFNGAYDSFNSGLYTAGMKCASAALELLDQLLEYADDVMASADFPTWECVRDALGSIVMKKAPLQDSIIKEYNLRIKRYTSPTFGDHPKRYVVKEHIPEGLIGSSAITTTETEDPAVFRLALARGTLIEATLDTLGCGYYWDKDLCRWVLDAHINPEVNPHLKRYMK